MTLFRNSDKIKDAAEANVDYNKMVKQIDKYWEKLFSTTQNCTQLPTKPWPLPIAKHYQKTMLTLKPASAISKVIVGVNGASISWAETEA